MYLKRRISDCIAKALVIAGMAISLGSVGACENEDYTILQCATCVTCGIALGIAGVEMRKEERR